MPQDKVQGKRYCRPIQTNPQVPRTSVAMYRTGTGLLNIPSHRPCNAQGQRDAVVDGGVDQRRGYALIVLRRAVAQQNRR